MSFTRLDYDGCAYAKELQESTSPLEYLMYKGKYENVWMFGGVNKHLFGPIRDMEN